MGEALWLALFPLGVLVGLIIGPAKERIEAAYIDGFISGMRYGKTRKGGSHD